MSEPFVKVDAVCKTFVKKRRLFLRSDIFYAVKDVSFTVKKGHILGIVGESGSGKSTLAHIMLGLLSLTSGKVTINDNDIFTIPAIERYRTVQLVFQDPVSALNPRKTIGYTLSQPLKRLLRLNRSECQYRLHELMEQVNLSTSFLSRYPHEISGGQAQRIGIARALAVNPGLLILDEPTSALDVSVQAQIIQLLRDLKQTYKLTYIFISHDLAVVECIADEVLVMRSGEIVEYGTAEQVLHSPQTSYTQTLVRSAPVLSSKMVTVQAQSSKGTEAQGKKPYRETLPT